MAMFADIRVFGYSPNSSRPKQFMLLDETTTRNAGDIIALLMLLSIAAAFGEDDDADVDVVHPQ